MNRTFTIFCTILLLFMCGVRSHAGNYSVGVGESTYLYCTASAPAGGWITHAFYELADPSDIEYLAINSYSSDLYAEVYGLKAKSNIKVLVTYAYSYRGTYDNNIHVGHSSYYDYVTVTGSGGVVATGIKMTPSDVQMSVGETVDIRIELTPSNAKTSYTWGTVDALSSPPSYYSITQSGNVLTVTAKKKMSLYLIAQTANNLTATCVIKATDEKKLKLNASVEEGMVEIGTKVLLESPDVSDAEIYYTLDGSSPSRNSTRYSSNGVTISSDCTLKAIAYKEGYTESDILQKQYVVKIRPTDITVSVLSKRIPVGGTTQISYQTIPANANTDLNVTWSSEDENVATVNSMTGTIEGHSAGTTYLRATCSNGTTSICKIQVTDKNLEGITNVASIAAQSYGSLVVMADGGLWTCGMNDRGQLGDGTKSDRSLLVHVMNDVKLSSGSLSCLFALKSNGDLYGCGKNAFGQLGIGNSDEVLLPILLMSDVESVSAGLSHTCILKTDGSLWTCGYGSSGELGNGSTTSSKDTPVKILTDVKYVSTRHDHSLAIKSDNSLWAWGYNRYGQLGDGTTTNRTRPVKIMDDVAQASAGDYHSLAIKSDGSLWAWGSNGEGAFGNGTTTDRRSPLKIMDDVAFARAGIDCSYIIKKDGSLWVCGYNKHGQLGDGANTNRLTPVQVMDSVKDVVCGSYTTLILKNDGSVWGCGSNGHGQLGVNAISDDNYTEWTQMLNPVFPSAVTLEKSEQTILTGGTVTLNYTINTPGSTAITWSSDDTSVATVSANGVVKGVREGVTFINAKTTNGDIDWCKVTVQQNGRGLKVTTSDSGYATFYDSSSAYTLPVGLSAQVVTGVVNNKLLYETLPGVVPRGTAVMLSSDVGYTFTLTPSDVTTAYTGTNLLHGSDTPTTTTGNGYHYKLSYGPSGTNLNDVFGWYWGAQNGAPFQIEGHKAWLVVPKSSGARGFTIDGDATGIDDVVEESGRAAFYDLQGRHVEQPIKKGVYIKNGKKVIIK